jgi:hypothetical protein
MERAGLAYQQHGVDYLNPHYDMSFVLKNLTLDEFRQLKTMVGQKIAKINNATADNYVTLAFTATEFEQLKKELDHHKQYWLTSFFYTSPANAVPNKLQFDFKSLITALDTYVTNYDRWDYHQLDEAWLNVGKAQREVPAHIAHEYCRSDRSFDPRPEFNEETLPRCFTFDNYVTNVTSWFPLTSSSSGLGVDFGLLSRAGVRRWMAPRYKACADLAAVSHLDEVRTADLTQSRAILERASPNHGLGLIMA